MNAVMLAESNFSQKPVLQTNDQLQSWFWDWC